MQREIKFRAWLTIAKKWIDVNKLEVLRDGQASPSNQSQQFLTTGKLIHPIDLPETTTIQQYTGIKDINGKEIYEGDIIKNHTPYEEYCRLAVVVWGKYEYCYWALAVLDLRNKIAPEVVHNINGFALKEELPLYQKYFGSYEILGNVYENSDLLIK